MPSYGHKGGNSKRRAPLKMTKGPWCQTRAHQGRLIPDQKPHQATLGIAEITVLPGLMNIFISAIYWICLGEGA